MGREAANKRVLLLVVAAKLKRRPRPGAAKLKKLGDGRRNSSSRSNKHGLNRRGRKRRPKSARRKPDGEIRRRPG
jgi:hypothetical protein